MLFFVLFIPTLLFLTKISLIVGSRNNGRSNVSATLRFLCRRAIVKVGFCAIKSALTLLRFSTVAPFALRTEFSTRTAFAVLIARSFSTLGALNRSFTPNYKRRSCRWNEFVALFRFRLFFCFNFGFNFFLFFNLNFFRRCFFNYGFSGFFFGFIFCLYDFFRFYGNLFFRFFFLDFGRRLSNGLLFCFPRFPFLSCRSKCL